MKPDPRMRELYAHPVGRDSIDKVVLQLGLSRRWVNNPVVSRLRLSTVARLARPVLGPTFADSLLSVLADHPEVPARGDSDGPAGEPASDDPDARPWWNSAVFYQVYPRSFADSDGDGIGDLPGVLSRLDHLAELGVDCLWLSPIFDSPNEDMGYDIRDYRAVMAEMGTLSDLDALIAGCHERGMRIILDLVVNHTSEEHPWFDAAVADPEGPDGDYYFLRPRRPDGRPPNNWSSFFGGSAWRWLPMAERWALHLFAPGQMDLNWENPAVRREVADIVRWWRARGVDGFRLDVINYISKRPGLPDGDAGVGQLMGFPGIEHYFFGPRLHEYLRELRENGFTRTVGDPPPTSTVRARRRDGSLGDPLPPDHEGVMVGETPGVGVEMGRLLSDADRRELDLVFNFDVLDGPGRTRWDDYRYDPGYLKRFLTDYLSRTTDQSRVALFLDNHDNPRMLSKVLGPRDRDPTSRTSMAKVLATIQLLWPGTPFLFQGQEIAAINQRFTSVAQLRDVESLNRYADLVDRGLDPGAALATVLPGARDHARVPMRWVPGDAASAEGFSEGPAWQPAREDSTGFTVAEQNADPESVLSFHRDVIRLRRAETALTTGGIRLLAPRSSRYFGWIRTTVHGDWWLVEVNLTPHRIRRPLAALRSVRRAEVVLGTVRERGLTMAPYEVVIARIDSSGPGHDGRPVDDRYRAGHSVASTSRP